MATKGIEGFLIETHNYGKSVAFWRGLGFELEFETGHDSGQLRHPGGGPFIFVAERPADAPLLTVPMLTVADPADFEPPAAGTVERPFELQHFGAMEMLLKDPDSRVVSIQAPAPASQPAH